jgi:hypothetical protein
MTNGNVTIVKYHGQTSNDNPENNLHSLCFLNNIFEYLKLINVFLKILFVYLKLINGFLRLNSCY